MPSKFFCLNNRYGLAGLVLITAFQLNAASARQNQSDPGTQAPAPTTPTTQPTPVVQPTPATQPPPAGQSAPTPQPAPAAQPTPTTPTTPATADTGILTNKDILDMYAMGLSPDILVAKIKSSPCNFETSPSQLQQLKTSGLPDPVILAMIQAPAGPTKTAAPDAPLAASADPKTPPNPPSDGKTRVFVTDSESWETRGSGSGGGNGNGWGASSSFSGGARPQTAEIIKTVNERCPEFTVTDNLGRADFVLTLDHEGGKGALAHRNKIAVFNRDGDDIFSASTRELGNSVKDACQAMLSSKK
jgi:hypothetical protein